MARKVLHIGYPVVSSLLARHLAGNISSALRNNIEQEQQHWDLVWYSGKTKKETVLRNTTRSLCYAKKNELEKTTHKSGKLVVQLSK